MKSYLPKVAGLALLAMMIRTSAFSQDDNSEDSNHGSRHHVDEIIIRHKGDKDTKVTIEMKDGDVLVNGKPLSEFDDSSLSIRKMRINRYGNNSFSFNGDEFRMPDIAEVPGTVRVFPNGPDGMGWNFNNGDLLGPRAFLGVATEKNNDGAGVKIVSINREKIGLKVGDIITRVDGEEITDPASLSEKIRSHQPGDKVSVTIVRDGKEQTQTVVLGKTKTITGEPFNTYRFDMPDMKIAPRAGWPKEFPQIVSDQPRFGIRAQDAEDGKGVKVLDVDDESTAEKAGIREGDVITRFDGKEVNSVAQLSEAAHAAKDKINVKVTVIRDGKSEELEVRVPRKLHTADL
ncbi:MAG TPA: PDZ domain-containing protein [Puia sp.]|nr:PDZ domain-containing protein [Puia sp.]